MGNGDLQYENIKIKFSVSARAACSSDLLCYCSAVCIVLVETITKRYKIWKANSWSSSLRSSDLKDPIYPLPECGVARWLGARPLSTISVYNCIYNLPLISLRHLADRKAACACQMWGVNRNTAPATGGGPKVRVRPGLVPRNAFCEAVNLFYKSASASKECTMSHQLAKANVPIMMKVCIRGVPNLLVNI